MAAIKVGLTAIHHPWLTDELVHIARRASSPRSIRTSWVNSKRRTDGRFRLGKSPPMRANEAEDSYVLMRYTRFTRIPVTTVTVFDFGSGRARVGYQFYTRLPIFERNMRYGFTLIELVVVVLILGILAGIAAPHLFYVAEKAQASAELSSARVVLDAANRFKASNGDFPRDALSGEYPSDFNGLLQANIFAATSPSGGQYDWDGPPPHTGAERFKIRYPAGTNAASLPLYPILEEADDGLPGSGWIRTSGRFINFLP